MYVDFFSFCSFVVVALGIYMLLFNKNENPKMAKQKDIDELCETVDKIFSEKERTEKTI
jgi:hypothetical protein